MQHEVWVGEQRQVRSGLARARAASSAKWIADQRFIVVLATLIGALVRLPTLAAKGFWYDELISVNIAQEPVGTILRARLGFGASSELVDRLYTNNPPLHLLLIHATRYLSTDEAVIRLLFALAGIATVPVAYLLLLRLFDRTIAALAAALLAVSPIHVAYSQEARPTVLFVLLSVLALLFLLKALDGEGRENWVAFTAVAIVACWTSYFALTLVLPALAGVTATKLAGGWRHPLPSDGWRALRAPALSFGAVAVAALPLLPDLLMTAGRNQVAASDSGARILILIPLSLVSIAGLVHPAPWLLWPCVPVFAMTMIGIWATVRKPDRRAVITVVWIIVPCLMLLLLSSSHGVYYRYLLPILPIVLAIPFVGIEAPLALLRPKLGTRAVQVARGSLVALLFASYVFGVAAYERGFIATGPIKRDWRGLLREYSANATPNSCLVLLDDLALAFYNEVPHYLKQSDPAPCVVDVRDPRLLDVVSTLDDLWWGVALPQEDRPRLAAAFSGGATTEQFTLLLLIHTGPGRSGAAVADAEATLQTIITGLASPPAGRSGTLAAREGLANLYVLSGRPAPAAALVAEIDTYWGDTDVQQWGHARRCLARGELDRARALAMRLIALYPGHSEAYDFLADVEERAGGSTAPAYRALAGALRS